MGLSLDDIRQLRLLLRPLATKIANTIARGVVQLADDGLKLQLLQLGVLAGETIDDVEHFQPYGFSSVPLAGAEAAVAFPNGDRSHPIAIAVTDRRYRPIRGEGGQVNLYHYSGSKLTMLANGNIELQPGPGGEVLIRDEGGTVDRLVKKSEFDGHTHGPGTFTTPSAGGGGGPVTGASGGAAAVAGTQRLRSQ
jgi:phage baseplate assembly protein V